MKKCDKHEEEVGDVLSGVVMDNFVQLTSALWEGWGMQADTKLKTFLHALLLVIMPSEWSSDPLIGHHTL